jgi:hypothetical protein
VTDTGLPRLRPYQAEAGRAILDSVTRRLGRTFTVEMSRQSGKNELSAQLETTILAAAVAGAFAPDPVEIVKTAPTYTPQVALSIRRLRDRLRAARLPHEEHGHIISLGNARAVFLSAEPGANVVGHTANPLLEIDEAQDVDPDKFDKEFRPMAAAFNATTVLYGTAWSEIDLLHRERQRALDAQSSDGVRRAFVIPWPIPAQYSPAYNAFVNAERERLGATHPMFTTQYDLIPLPGKGRFLNHTLIAQLTGDFPRRATPPTTAVIAAGLDIAGGDDDAPERHDRTVLTLAAVTPPSPADPVPQNHAAVLHQIAWHGTPHDQLLPALLDIIVNVWRPAQLTIDATGLGETTARIIASRSPRTTVTPFKFTRPSKSELGFALLSAISTGRTKVYAHDGSDDARTFWSEAALARADYLPGRFLNFYVAQADGHDDYLISLALCQHAIDNAQPRIARGRTP